MLNFDDQDVLDSLKILGLTKKELEDLADEEQRQKIRKRYFTLSLQLHPDKNKDPNAEEQFAKVDLAYKKLSHDPNAQGYISEIMQYFNAKPIKISNTDFDMFMEDAIEHSYQELLKKFSQLSNNHTKQRFINTHSNFINLAQTLQNKRDTLLENRKELFGQLQNQPLWEKFEYEWRELIISLFGEEYLDDFAYRDALATGNLIDILALRKILSPIKLVVAILNTIILGVSTLFNYLWSEAVIPLVTEACALYNDYNNDQLDALNVLIFCAKLIAFTCITSYFADILLPLLGLPLLASALKMIATPVNSIIRPLAFYTGLPAELLSISLGIAAAAGVTALVTMFPASLATMLFEPLVITLGVALYYQFGRLIKNFYDINPALALMEFGIFLTSFIISLFSPVPDIAETDILSILINIGLLYQANTMIENAKNIETEKFQELPLPEQPVAEHVKDAMLHGVKTGHYSHKFFNTATDAHYLTSDEHTFGQQTSSFFGGGEKTPAVEEEILDESSIPLLGYV